MKITPEQRAEAEAVFPLLIRYLEAAEGPEPVEAAHAYSVAFLGLDDDQ